MERETLTFAAFIDAAAGRYSDSDRLAGMMNFADGIACAYAGYRRPEMDRLLRSPIIDSRTGDGAWLIGSPLRCRASDAVLLNAFAAHLDDFDDDEAIVSIAHVTVPTMAATLAAASLVNPSGVSILNAYLSGVQTMVALGEMLNPTHYALGWHASATLGVFGAAMAAGHVLGLSTQEKATALAFAVTAGSGTRSAFGSSAKAWQVAAAARNGFDAALLAKAGLDANASLFGRMGLAALYGGHQGRLEAVLARMDGGSPFKDPGVTIKAYPCCTAAHTAMEACEIIRGRMPTEALRSIASIRITVGRTIPSILVHDKPTTALEGKFSMQFCAAAALCLPSIGLEAFRDETFANPIFRHLMERVEMVGVEEQDDPFLCEVTVTLSDGSLLSESVMRTKGCPERPFELEDMKRKFASLCQGADAVAAFDHLYELPSAPDWQSFERRLSGLLGQPIG